MFVEKMDFFYQNRQFGQKWVGYILIELVPETSTSVSREVSQHKDYILCIHKDNS